MAASAYEAWVVAVRAWRDDPRHDMSNLPQLTVDSLPPSAYERLFAHLSAAHQHVMDQWSEAFAREWGSARDDHARVRALMGTRMLLARRLQLAGHPGLPAAVREGLVDGVARDVNALQSQLEEAVSRQSGHRIDRIARERTLRLLRTNALTVILEPGFPLQALIDGRVDEPQSPHLAPLPEPEQSGSGWELTPSPRRRYRAIIVDN